MSPDVDQKIDAFVAKHTCNKTVVICHRAWKTELQSQIADSLGLAVTVAHYPTGASKWNPIEQDQEGPLGLRSTR